MRDVNRTIRIAKEQDMEQVVGILGQAGLSSAGVDENVDNFIVVENHQEKIIGAVGIEPIEKDGILRSLVITQEGGVDSLFELLECAVSLAKEKEMQHLYLLSKKATTSTLFQMFGFDKVDNPIPEHIQNSEHVQNTTNSWSATMFVRKL